MKVQEQVFGRRSAVSPLQGDTRDCLASRTGFLAVLQWLVVNILTN